MREYKVITTEGQFPVKGYPVKIEGLPEHKFFVHHPVCGLSSWKVSEVSTGMGMMPLSWDGCMSNKTRAGAIAIAKAHVKALGILYVSKCIKAAKKIR